MEQKDIYVMYGNSPKEMVPHIMSQLRLENRLNKNASIALKPNLVVAKPSLSGATTDPELVEALIVWLKEHGYKNLSIIESAWVGDSTERAYDRCGYCELSKKHNVPLYDLKKDSHREIAVKPMTVKVCSKALESDFLINMPVLKAHCQTKMTCALKNLKGCIPDSEKRRFHSLGLHQPIACLSKALPIGLTIVDGIIGDLSFEEGGTPVQMNRIIAGYDAVAIDAYVAGTMGYEPSDIDYIVMADALQVGTMDLKQAKVVELNSGEQAADSAYATHRVNALTHHVKEDAACSACYGSLMHALERLRTQGKLKGIEKDIYIGQGYKDKRFEDGIGIGRCTEKCSLSLQGCPPKADAIVRFILETNKNH